jgi:hypothetical protein
MPVGLLAKEGTMSDLWRTLKIGDRVRVIDWPQEIHKDRLCQETSDLYKWLIATGGLLTIVRIDDLGLPEGSVRRVVDGKERSEFLLLNHSGLEIVAETRLN